MSFDIIPEPTVKSPGDATMRRGRGFTRDELKQVTLTVKDARDMGLIVDLRRKTMHPENVEFLKQYIKEMDAVVASLADDKPTAAATDSVTELSSLRAVKKAEAESLVTAGIKTLSDLAYCDIPKIAAKTGIDEDRMTAMVKAALAKV